jgi:putative hydrolase
MQLVADYHTHTVHSHGLGTVEDNVLAAVKRGLEAVAITDHGPANLFHLGVKTPSVLLGIKDEVLQAGERFPELKVMVGVEANVISVNGDLDVPVEVLSQLDMVLVGLHQLVKPKGLADGLSLGALNLAAKYSRRAAEKARKVNTQALIEAVRRYDVDIVTHPGLHLSVDTASLASACAQVGTALEISAGHPYMTTEFVEVARDEGAVFAIGSDAHSPERVGDLSRGLAVAEAAQLSARLVINAKH